MPERSTVKDEDRVRRRLWSVLSVPPPAATPPAAAPPPPPAESAFAWPASGPEWSLQAAGEPTPAWLAALAARPDAPFAPDLPPDPAVDSLPSHPVAGRNLRLGALSLEHVYDRPETTTEPPGPPPGSAGTSLAGSDHHAAAEHGRDVPGPRDDRGLRDELRLRGPAGPDNYDDHGVGAEPCLRDDSGLRDGLGVRDALGPRDDRSLGFRPDISGDHGFGDHAGSADDPERSGSLSAGAFSSSGHGLRAFDPGRRGVKALAAVAVVVVLIAGYLAWQARPDTEPVPDPPVPPGTTAEAGAPAPGPSAAGEVVVAVAGKVRKPGLVRLPPGARVADALAAAGGAAPGVDTALLNLARKLVDGELIVVGATPPPGGTATVPSGGGPAQPGAPVNLNTATLADLDRLPGVGPVLAQRILDHRDRQGGFRTVADLRKIDGIGDSRYEQLKDLVTV